MNPQTTSDNTVVEAMREKTRNFGVLTQEQSLKMDNSTKASNVFDYCLQGRRPYELEWFIDDTFHRDRNVLRYNVNSKMLEPMPSEKAVSRVNVNKSKQLVRGVTSYLTREHPMVNIIAGTQEDEAYSKAKKEQYLYEHWYDHLLLNNVHKKVASQGARHGISWAKVLENDSVSAPTDPYFVVGDDGEETQFNTVKGEIEVFWSDNYSVYADWRATSKADMRFINEAIPRTIGEIASNPKYDKNVLDQVSADDKSSLSTLKLESMTNGGGRTPEMANHADPMQRTVIIRETYIKELDVVTDLLKFDDWKWLINLYVTTDSKALLYKDRWPIDEFPYEYFQTDVADMLYETDGIIRDIRGLQQALSRGASQTEETMQTMGKINWLIPRGAGVTVITDRTGQFVQYNPAAGKPEQSRPADLPSYSDKHMDNLERWIDDIGGIHDATYGRLPTSRASGDLVQALQAGDSSSLQTYKDNYADFIAREAKLMFKTAKHLYKTTGSRLVPIKAGDGTGIPQWAKLSANDIVLEDNVRVQVGTGLPYDQSERMKLVGDWVDKKMITPDQGIKLANIRALTDVLGDNQNDIDRQVKENQVMLKNKDVDDPVIPENHDVHIEVLDQLIKSDRWPSLPDPVKQKLLDHRGKHLKLSISMKKLMASLNVEPIKRSESMMVRENSTADMTPIVSQQWWDKFGIESDSAEMQMRGGLFVQDPQQAVSQSDRENQMMAQSYPSKVSMTDNHLVHLEVHQAYVMKPTFKDTIPPAAQKLFQEHVQQHMVALKATTPQPGLVQNSSTGDSIPITPLNTANMKAKAKVQAAAQVKAQSKSQKSAAPAPDQPADIPAP